MATASDSAATTMAFWKPGMPVKAFDPYSIERVKADLADGSITEFPIEDYKEYLIQKVRETAMSEGMRNFTVEPTQFNYGAMLQHHYVEEIIAFRDGCAPFHEDFEKYVSGVAYISYETPSYSKEDIILLQICIGIGNDTGFDNPTFIGAAYKITWIGSTVFDGNEDFD